MQHNNHMSDEYKARIFSKSKYRLQHCMQKEMHRPWPNTDKIWRVQQRCRQYEHDLCALPDVTHDRRQHSH